MSQHLFTRVTCEYATVAALLLDYFKLLLSELSELKYVWKEEPRLESTQTLAADANIFSNK